MDLFKYFKQEGKRDCLPDPHGPLNKQVPLSSIEEAKKVDSCYKETSKEKKCFPYNFVMPEQKVKVAKYAAVNGTITIQWIVLPLLINSYCTKKWYFLWNVTNDDTVDSTYCDNISIFGGIIQFPFASYQFP